MINKLSSSSLPASSLLDQKGETTWNSSGADGDVFLPDKSRGLQTELAFREAARNLQTLRAAEARGVQTEELVSNFPNRAGYDQSFLGKPLPLPALDSSIRDKAATLIGQPDETELKYTHFSIVMNKERRQPFFTAVNIDGASSADVPRDGEWTIDGRIPRDAQLGNEAYRSNHIDKGHQVRRSDPAWGPDAHQASDDTFAYPNSGLQHEQLNQKEWLELENHVLDSAKTGAQKMTVLTGPVFRDDDPPFDNKGAVKPPTQIPRKFWKMVVWNDPKDGLKAAAFVLSQEDLINKGGLFQAGFEPGRFQIYQVPIQKLEEMTRLDFGAVTDVTKQTQVLTAATGYRPVV